MRRYTLVGDDRCARIPAVEFSSPVARPTGATLPADQIAVCPVRLADPSLNHLIRAQQQRLRNGQALRLCGFVGEQFFEARRAAHASSPGRTRMREVAATRTASF